MTAPNATERPTFKANAFWAALSTFARLNGIKPAKLSRLREMINSNESTQTPRTNAWQHFPGLTAKTWHDVDEFPGMQKLVDAIPDIRNELAVMQEQGRFNPRPPLRIVEGQLEAGFLRYLGTPMVGNCRLCPNTMALLDGLDNVSSFGLVYFSALHPGTRLNEHYSHTNAILRAEVVLETPSGSTIQVGDSVRELAPGECLMFDEAFGCKYTNAGDSTHLSLAFDIWHPELTREEIVGLNWFSKLSRDARRRGRAAAHAALHGETF